MGSTSPVLQGGSWLLLTTDPSRLPSGSQHVVCSPVCSKGLHTHSQCAGDPGLPQLLRAGDNVGLTFAPRS